MEFAPTAEDGFISYNYVVQLKADRLALPEYAHFAGMACEVQVQTTLDHAWSEMAHDTIYKPPPAGFGGRITKDVADRMTEIMQKYLRPAGFEFQKVVGDVRRLERGRALLARDPLSLLEMATDNNERYRLLDEYERCVVPYYDELRTLAPKLRKAMIAVAKAARVTPVKALTIGSMSVRGHTADRVVAKALDVIDRLSFTSPSAIDATFRAICELFPKASPRERDRLFNSLEHLAKHNLHIWQAAGPLVQVRLVRLIGRLAEKRRTMLRPVLIRTLQHVLDPNVQGSTSTYSTVTLHMGAVVATADYLTARRDAISMLETLFEASSDIVELREILHAFNTAGRLADHGSLSAEMVEATMVDTIRVVRFVEKLVSKLPYEVLQAYEDDLVWAYRHSAALPPTLKDDAKLEAKREELRSAILSFRDTINADREFVIYKTLVGFESVFPMAWESDGMDIQAAAEYRAGEITRLVSTVDDGTFNEWLARIRRCAQTKSNDGATFPSFRSFLVELGRAKPNLLVRLFDNLDQDLDWFVSSMLQGLEGGPLEARAIERAAAWIEEGKHLLQIVAYCDFAKTLDGQLLENATRAAIKAGDHRTVAASMGVCVKRHADAEQLAGAVFENALAYFVAEKRTDWVDSVWYRIHESDFITTRPQAQRDAILNNLVHLPQIDFHAEEVLLSVARSEPLKFLPFFHERILIDGGEDTPERYEAIPYKFHRVHTAFGGVVREVVRAVRPWFDEDAALFEYRGGALVARLYPDFGSVIDALRDLALGGQDRDVEYVLTILRGYKGASSILPLCRDIVAKVDTESPLLRQVDFALEQSGMVRGEFGRVELYQTRLADMQPWLTDDSLNVRRFAERRIKALDLAIKSEQRLSKEQLELRKREYRE